MNTARRPREIQASAADSGATATPDRLLSCMAGFYANEAQARAALRLALQTWGLLPAQTTLLSPDDAGPLRFARVAHRWAGDLAGARPPRIGDGWVASGLGAALAGAAALAWIQLGLRQSDNWQWVLLMTAGVLGGLLAAGLLALWARPPPAHRFNDQVRRQLGLGCWALVAYQVPWAAQAGVVKLLRDSSLRWCAAAPPVRRL